MNGLEPSALKTLRSWISFELQEQKKHIKNMLQFEPVWMWREKLVTGMHHSTDEEDFRT
jgi:hypothetical protein